jgi:hypothetical protein
MSVNVSVRLDDRLAERLRLRARAAGESLSDRLRRYAEEAGARVGSVGWMCGRSRCGSTISGPAEDRIAEQFPIPQRQALRAF